MLRLDVPPYVVTRLDRADVQWLQDLYVRCSDHHELEEGIPTRAGAAEHLLEALPPGKACEDKLVIGIQAPAGPLLGVLDMIRDYPGERSWWLGLLMLDPAARSNGLGTRMVQSLHHAVTEVGGTAIYLGVLEHNGAAEQFNASPTSSSWSPDHLVTSATS